GLPHKTSSAPPQRRNGRACSSLTARGGGLPVGVIETRRAEAPALAHHRHGHMAHKQIKQHGDAPYQSHIIALVGVLKTTVEVFDSGTTELYPEAHGCILLVGCLARVL